MGNEADKNKFTWVIKNFSSLQSKTCSKRFVIGGCKWNLVALLKGRQNDTPNYLSLYMCAADFKILPIGWKRHIKFNLTVVNQLSDKHSERREIDRCLDRDTFVCGYPEMISLTKLNAKKGGFVVNDEVKIVVEIDFLQVIGGLDVSVSEESQEVTTQPPLKRTKLNHNGAVLVSSSVDVNGFQVLPSQAESVKLIFERHPDMALEFRAKNQHLRTSCINLLLNLIETLCQSNQDLFIDDLNQGVNTLTYLKCSGFKVDWLERKLHQVKKTKNEEQICEIRMKELEEELKFFNQKCSDIEAQPEKEKEELKVFKQKCLYIEARVEKEKEELKDSKQKCSDIEGMMDKEKAKVLAATRVPLTLEWMMLSDDLSPMS